MDAKILDFVQQMISKNPGTVIKELKEAMTSASISGPSQDVWADDASEYNFAFHILHACVYSLVGQDVHSLFYFHLHVLCTAATEAKAYKSTLPLAYCLSSRSTGYMIEQG